jgi:hypothetical protein
MARRGARQTLTGVTVRRRAQETRMQMVKKMRLQVVHDKKQGMPPYLRGGGGR